MNYKNAKEKCHVRSAIYRTGDTAKIYSIDDLNKIEDIGLRDLCRNKVGTIVPKVYWKNHTVSLDARINDSDKKFQDWEEYDPREMPECAAFNETPA